MVKGRGAQKTDDLTLNDQRAVVGSRCFLKVLRGLYDFMNRAWRPFFCPPNPFPGRLHTHVPWRQGRPRPLTTAGPAAQLSFLRQRRKETVMPAGLWKTWHTPHVSIRLHFCGHKRQDQTLVLPCFLAVAAGGRTAAREVSVPGNGLVSENWTWEHSPWGWGELIHWATGLTPWPPSY